MKKRGFTLIELLVVIAIIAMLLAILMPALNKVKKIAQRVVCGTNLKGLGNAMTVYANDFRGQYPCQGEGKRLVWARATDQAFQAVRTWTDGQNITLGASLYLLVRLADVGPKSFVCPSSDQVEFSGKNPSNFDIVELWDFGRYDGGTDKAYNAEGPEKCVSYSYHQPYGVATGASTASPGRYRADDTRSAAFALMADKNPWYDPKLPETTFTGANLANSVDKLFAYWVTNNTPSYGTVRQNQMVANAQPHEREGQNVMYADGHNSFEKISDVGIKNDNIYTPYSQATIDSTKPAQWRQGLNPITVDRAGADEEPRGMEDTFLANDYGDKVR
ncbi:MAG TPA: type II secretion system protein [Anaerohalosphaeraceae bacterium]|nr:type II secretion system protein [Anaerohalosphaeraceae bacterium]HQG06294.1 type II secretion system protein [Anaerohalosphaeraceae bacterium]HQI07647.1 type II secretion system protein [Anaerohalosphaeraceae bacterium]HQJ67864.1 type II secretion system protein [Anaerohalosphaeraceae bacterium]